MTRTRIEYNIDKTLEIKEEIIQDQESFSKITTGLMRNLKYEAKPDGDPDSCITTNISSDKNSENNIFIKYENDETLYIKEEIIQDQKTNEAAGQKPNKKYVSKLLTVDRREDDILAAEKLRSQKKEKIQDLKLENKYKCEKCARCYKQKTHLNRHQKFECDVMPQFGCNFCGKRFGREAEMNKHINRMHQKTNSEISKTRHNCDKCSRSYIWLNDLYRHKRLEHKGLKIEFICDYCSHKSKQKCHLSTHITKRHLK